MKRAVVPGTFDPITAGHFDVISRAAQIFDEVVVAVAKSAKKSPIFDLETRVGLVEEAVADLPNVRVISFEGLLVDCVHQLDAHVVVKGLRAITDFEYEFQMTALNYELSHDLETFFIMSPPLFTFPFLVSISEILAKCCFHAGRKDVYGRNRSIESHRRALHAHRGF